MAFLQITLPLGAADPAPYEDALLDAGASCLTLEDEGDDPVLEPLPGTTPLWPRVRIKALFDAEVDGEQVLARLRAHFGQPLAGAQLEHLADRAWEREWLKDFRPMRFGERLWICPGGLSLPDDLPAQPAPVVIELDPGLAFGTGTHPTTALCLQWLDANAPQGLHVIDYGCGSGILAIAAARLGAHAVQAVDIDPQALLATEDNALRNGVQQQIKAQLVADARLQPVDVLLANILAGPLQQLSAELSSLVRPGGRLVLSGILQEQAEAVSDAYRAWFDMDPPATQEDWVRLTGVRRAATA